MIDVIIHKMNSLKAMDFSIPIEFNTHNINSVYVVTFVYILLLILSVNLVECIYRGEPHCCRCMENTDECECDINSFGYKYVHKKSLDDEVDFIGECDQVDDDSDLSDDKTSDEMTDDEYYKFCLTVSAPENVNIIHMLKTCKDNTDNYYKKHAYDVAMCDVASFGGSITLNHVINNQFVSEDGTIDEWYIGSRIRERIIDYLSGISIAEILEKKYS